MRRTQRRGRWLLRVVTYVFCGFMLGPVVVLVGSAFTSRNYVQFPPHGLSLKWFTSLASDSGFLRALMVSLIIATLSMLICVGLGLGAVLLFRRLGAGHRRMLEAFYLLPALAPSLVIGIGLLFMLSKVGLVGNWYGLLGGHVVLGLPFAIRSIASAVAALDVSYERAATAAGASPAVVLRRVTLPMLRPGIVAGSLFAFLMSFNNITITVFIARSNLQTVPLLLFSRSQDIVSPSVAAIAVVVLALTVIVVVLLERFFSIFQNAREQVS